jgi:hypothetical protein
MIIKGDINGDGRVNLDDAAILMLHLHGKIELTGDKFNAADINNDGKLNTADLAALRLHRLGIKMIEGGIQQ